MNCVPLSEMIAVGKPHLLNTLVSCVIMILTVAVLIGIASGHHVASFFAGLYCNMSGAAFVHPLARITVSHMG